MNKLITYAHDIVLVCDSSTAARLFRTTIPRNVDE